MLKQDLVLLQQESIKIADLIINHNSTRITGNHYNSYAAPAAAATLYADWLPPIYHITLNKSGGSGGTTDLYYRYNYHNGNCYYYTNAAATTCLTNSTLTKPTLSGKIFDGYYTTTGGGGTQYVSGINYSNRSTTVAGGVFINDLYTKKPSEINSSYTDTITLYAAWGTEYSGSDVYLINGAFQHTSTGVWYYFKTYYDYKLIKGGNGKIRGFVTIKGKMDGGQTDPSWNAYIYGTFKAGNQSWYCGGLQSIPVDFHTFAGTESSPLGTGTSITVSYTSDGGNAMNNNATRTISLS